MEKDLITGNLGSVGKYDLALNGNALTLSVDLNLGPVAVKVAITPSVREILDLLKTAVPGTIDDAIINAIEAGLGV